MMKVSAALLCMVFVSGCALLPGNEPEAATTSLAPIIEEGNYAEHRAEIIINTSPDVVRAAFDGDAWQTALANDRKIASPVDSESLSGAWPEKAARRRVALSDGEAVTEEILTNAFPAKLQYQAWNFTGAAGSNINYVISDFEFLATEDGNTRMVWTHKMRAKSSFVQRFIGGFVSKKFAPFMEESLQDFAKSIEE